MPPPAIEPITEATLPDFARFLHENLDRRRSPGQWERALRTSWAEARPNYGYLMRAGERIVGGIGALYATRPIAGREERFCNITSWCVLEAYRKQSMRLAMTLVSQDGYHYTDFSPTPVVSGVLRFLKFKAIDDRQTVILNLPRPFSSGRVFTRPEEIASRLHGEDARSYGAHVGFPWLRHLLIGDGDTWSHVVYKRKSYKRLPSARILHMSDPEITSRHIGTLCSHLLTHGMATTHIESRRLHCTVQPSRIRTGFNARLYLSPTLTEESIDYLYSESVAMDL